MTIRTNILDNINNNNKNDSTNLNNTTNTTTAVTSTSIKGKIIKGSTTKKKSSSNVNNNVINSKNNETPSSFLTKYFLIILFIFACLSLYLNTRFTHIIIQDVSPIEAVLSSASSSSSSSSRAGGGNNNKQSNAATGGGGDDDAVKQPPRPQQNGNPDHEEDLELFSDNNNNNNIISSKKKTSNHHELNCDAYGGPSYEDAQEMVYWKDIPSDAHHVSPFHHTSTNNNNNNIQKQRQFMTFEPDQGGWNNIRMAMETVLTMAFAMGRTLVLPPHQKMYLLTNNANGKQKNEFSFEDFFHMERISQEHYGLDIISMEEFLRDYVMKGIFIDPNTQQPMFPPQNNRTNWDGCTKKDLYQLYNFLRNNITSTILLWNPEDCLAAFPKSTSEEDYQELVKMPEKIITTMGGFPKEPTQYVDHPTPVDASPEERFQEYSSNRNKLCIYDPELQHNTPWIHFPVERKGDLQSRLLVHFYAFLFFQDYHDDLWMKRFVRDHVRYIDEIQCAAGRVVQGIRKHVLKRTNGQSNQFDSMHVRRGDFQYTVTRAEIPDIYEMTSKQFAEGTTVFIATDERDKSFFDPLKEHYDVVFLDDFLYTIPDINTNYYGMIDQLVASRGRIFYGCWFSTFTGYINRLRGYHHHFNKSSTSSNNDEDNLGIVPNSYYYALKDRYDHMQHYWPVKKSFYAREFPASWRMIDMDVEENE